MTHGNGDKDLEELKLAPPDASRARAYGFEGKSTLTEELRDIVTEIRAVRGALEQGVRVEVALARMGQNYVRVVLDIGTLLTAYFPRAYLKGDAATVCAGCGLALGRHGNDGLLTLACDGSWWEL